jgi:glutaredoxin
MTLRLLVLLMLVGGIGWLRVVLTRARHNDATRGADRLPLVPAALRQDGAAWIVFTTPMCVGCRSVEQLLAEHRPDDRVVLVDATTDPELASRWDIRRAPTTLHADRSGRVTARLVGVEDVRRHLVDASGATDSEPIPAHEAIDSGAA